jgi:hypothetical protein
MHFRAFDLQAHRPGHAQLKRRLACSRRQTGGGPCGAIASRRALYERTALTSRPLHFPVAYRHHHSSNPPIPPLHPSPPSPQTPLPLDHANGEIAAAMANWNARDGGGGVPRPTNPMVTPLLTDLYQFTMTYAYWKAGKHIDRAVLAPHSPPLKLLSPHFHPSLPLDSRIQLTLMLRCSSHDLGLLGLGGSDRWFRFQVGMGDG